MVNSSFQLLPSVYGSVEAQELLHARIELVRAFVPEVAAAIDEHEIDLGRDQCIASGFCHGQVEGAVLAKNEEHRLLDLRQPGPQVHPAFCAGIGSGGLDGYSQPPLVVGYHGESGPARRSISHI
jgi:hypothetical protein